VGTRGGRWRGARVGGLEVERDENNNAAVKGSVWVDHLTSKDGFSLRVKTGRVYPSGTGYG
jgi:hypothetical protein